MTLKVALMPDFDNPEKGEGGIRRVVEAQKKHLPTFGIELVTGPLEERLAQADLIALHGGLWYPTNKPTVSHCHGLYWREATWPKWAHAINVMVVNAMRQATVVTSPSKWVARAIERATWLDSPVLYHGIDPDNWPMGTVGTDQYVLWNKNRVDPICENDSLDELANRLPDTSFVSTFATRNPRPNITVTGRLALDAMRSYVAGASVYLCTTRETFGIGTLEAMASGVPILGWRWGGQREIVDHGVNGYLATPGDYDDLVRGYHECVTNRAKWGRSGRSKVLKKFTWPKIMEQYAELYSRTHREWEIAQKGPRVSVIITCYNLADTLGRAVASVEAQEGTGADHEIIIVNDASPDNTEHVAATLAAANPKIKVVNNVQNLYLAGALNAGVRASTGRYILPLDADNEISPHCLEVLGDALDNPNYRGDGSRIDIAYGAMGAVEPDGKRWISEWPPKVFNYIDQMSHKNQITSTALYRRALWSRVGGYRRRCRTAEDADFWCRATSFGAVPAQVTTAPTLVYYNRMDSMSRVEKDWAWHRWYPGWNSISGAPTLAPLEREQIPIPTYEPARVTVIIPVGPGHGELVVDAIDSVVAQDYERTDIIVINDTGAPLPWVPSFVNVINTKGAGGPAKARNLGIKASNTPLFLLLDADDYLQPNAISAMLSAYEPGTYVYSDWIKQESGERYACAEWDCVALLDKMPHSVTIMGERSAWLKCGGFDEKLVGWEDWDFLIALASVGVCGRRVPVPLFHYRMAAGTKRESDLVNAAQSKEAIRTKWYKYIVEGVPLAGCGSCGGRRAVVHQQYNQPAPAQMNSVVVSDGSENGLVQLEFTGEDAPRTYRGAESRTAYRFGSDDTHRVKYVANADVKRFLELPNFRLYTGTNGGSIAVSEKPLLEAAGPPARG